MKTYNQFFLYKIRLKNNIYNKYKIITNKIKMLKLSYKITGNVQMINYCCMTRYFKYRSSHGFLRC